MGNRDILFEGSSDYTGEIVVEEVIDEDGSLLRRLVFLSTPHMAQSEAKVIQSVYDVYVCIPACIMYIHICIVTTVST